MDLGYVTHGTHANSRMVYLETLQRLDNLLIVTGPPNVNIYPPGPGWLYVVFDDVPSEGVKVMVGDGRGPPVNKDAIAK